MRDTFQKADLEKNQIMAVMHFAGLKSVNESIENPISYWETNVWGTNNLLNVIIISDQETLKNINKSARNIKNLKIINDAGANIYDMMKYKNVLLTQSSIRNLEKRILNEKN